MANSPIRHHYLPQAYLRHFCRDEVIWVYDRDANCVRFQKVVDTAVKRHFYSIKNDDGTYNTWLESKLSEIESVIPALVDDLRSGAMLDSDRRFDLAFMAALMMTRTPDFHEGINRVEGGLLKKYMRMTHRTEEETARSIEEWRSENPGEPALDPEQIKHMFEFYSKGNYKVTIHRNRSIQHMLKLSPSFAETISKLNVGILHTPRRSSFITTDRPFVIMPQRDKGDIPRLAGVGILTPGAKKYLPLASDLAVVFGDPGDGFRHIDLTTDMVKAVNAVVGHMTDRFLMGRDKALVEAWSNRLDLANQPKIILMNLA